MSFFILFLTAPTKCFSVLMGQNPSYLLPGAALATGIKMHGLAGLKKKHTALKYKKRNSDIYLEFTLFHVNKQFLC